MMVNVSAATYTWETVPGCYVVMTTLMLIQTAAMSYAVHVRRAGVVGARSAFQSGLDGSPPEPSTVEPAMEPTDPPVVLLRCRKP